MAAMSQLGRRATGASRVGTVIFLGDEPFRYQRKIVSGVTMPEHLPPGGLGQNDAFHSQAAALVVGKA